jgi:hypothetical protein
MPTGPAPTTQTSLSRMVVWLENELSMKTGPVSQGLPMRRAARRREDLRTGGAKRMKTNVTRPILMFDVAW